MSEEYISNVSEQITPPTNIPPSAKPMSKIIIIIGGLILLIIGLSVGYFLSKSSSEIFKSQPIGKACTQEAKICPDGSSVGRTGPNCEFASCLEITSTQPSPTPNLYTESSQSATTNWKTYTNKIQGIDFKYPNNWYYLEHEEKSESLVIALSDVEMSKFPPDRLVGPIYINKFRLTGETYLQFLQRERDSFTPETLIENSSFLLSGKTATQLSGILKPSPAGEKPYSKITILEKDNFVFSISFYRFQNRNLESIYDQILSTFQFTNSVLPSTVQDLSWISKKIDLYNFEVTIPLDWSLVEVNRRPESTADYMVKSGHDCADYEIKSTDSSTVLSLKPVCGFGDGGASKVPADAVTVKTLNNNSEIIRVYSNPPGVYVYGTSGYADISDLNGTRREKTYVNVINFGEGQNLLDIYNSLKIAGPEKMKQSSLDISDKIVSSITLK